MNKARPLFGLTILQIFLAQLCVGGSTPTWTHVTSDLLNTGRFYMAEVIPTRTKYAVLTPTPTSGDTLNTPLWPPLGRDTLTNKD